MQTLLKLEYLSLLALSVVFFIHTEYTWWIYPLLILTPDIGMVGYLINTKLGAFTYNLFHHIGIAVFFLLVGEFLNIPWVILIGAILLGHSAIDRIFGYGLKYTDSFKHTHLGNL